MLNVSHRITMGSHQLHSGATSPLLSLRVDAAMHVPANRYRLVLQGQAEVSARPGDDVRVELGYDNALSVVFSGKVAAFEQGFDTIRVEALSAFTTLAATRFNKLYEKETAGSIVRDVLQRVEVQPGTVQPGLRFVTYALGDNQSAWSHVQGLAERCGFEFYADPEDQAVFRRSVPGDIHALTYGTDILAFDHHRHSPAVDGVEVYGASPAGQGQSEEASAWFTKKPVKGSAGRSRGNVLRVADPAVRNPDLAATVAGHLLSAHDTEVQGRIQVLGAAEVKLGDAVMLTRLPVSEHNGQARVTGVQHVLRAGRGFVSTICWEKTG